MVFFLEKNTKQRQDWVNIRGVAAPHPDTSNGAGLLHYSYNFTEIPLAFTVVKCFLDT